MIWYENRWNDRLQTKLNVTFWQEEKTTGFIRDKVYYISPLLGVVLRFRKGGNGRIWGELRNDLTFTHYNSSTSTLKESYNSYSNAFAFDYYPISVLILRTRLVTTYKDYLVPGEDGLNTTFEFRLTAQF